MRINFRFISLHTLLTLPASCHGRYQSFSVNKSKGETNNLKLIRNYVCKIVIDILSIVTLFCIPLCYQGVVRLVARRQHHRVLRRGARLAALGAHRRHDGRRVRHLCVVSAGVPVRRALRRRLSTTTLRLVLLAVHSVR